MDQKYYGEVDNAGQTIREPEQFIDTDRPYFVGLPCISERVYNTRYFYRLEAGADPTNADRENWQNGPDATPAKRSRSLDLPGVPAEKE